MNILDGAKGVIKALLKLDRAPDLVYADRLLTCGGCPARNGRRCGDCGCVLAWKASITGEGCPQGRWA